MNGLLSTLIQDIITAYIAFSFNTSCSEENKNL